MKITLYLEISLYSGDSVHVNVPLRKLGEAGNETSRGESENTYCGTFYTLCRCLQLPLAMPPLLTCQPHFQHSDFQAPVSEEAFGHS